MAVNYRVPGIVPAIAQGSSNRCWAACTTMLVSWKENSSYSMPTVIGQYGSPWIGYYNANQPLPFAQFNTFFQAVGLKSDAPQNYIVQGWVQLLKNRGPLIVGLDFDGNQNNLSHMVVLVAVKGDETPQGTLFYFNEPDAGQELSETWKQFAQRYEAADPMQASLQVAYWP